MLNIRYCTLNSEKDFKKLKKLLIYANKNNVAVACLIKKDVLFKKKDSIEKKALNTSKGIKREDFIKIFLKNLNSQSKIISTTGFTSRELFQIRSHYKFSKGKDFYMVGGMGHSSMVALGISLKTKKQVVCLDGDGSLLMHMGSLANIGFYASLNYKHVIFNNFCHESVGSQKTNTENIDIKSLALSMGYKKYYHIKNKKELPKILKKFFLCKGPCMLEVLTKNISMKNLVRPKNLLEIKKNFMAD